MRKLTKLASIALAAAISLSSCASMGGATGTVQPNNTPSGNSGNNSQGLLGSLLGSLIGSNTKVTEKSIVGTWAYDTPDCKFDSESALAKAGGEFAAAEVEQKLAEVYANLGIKKGNCSFTFNDDKTCQVKMGAMSFSGRYTINSETADINITSNTGLIKLNGKVYNNLGGITLLFDAKKLLSLAKTVGTFAGGMGSTLSTLSALLNQYDGMMVGMNLKK